MAELMTAERGQPGDVHVERRLEKPHDNAPASALEVAALSNASAPMPYSVKSDSKFLAVERLCGAESHANVSDNPGADGVSGAG
jgi:hypothetical protein